MPAFEQMDRHDPAVLWLLTGKDRFNEPTRGNPCAIKVNWGPDKRSVRLPDGTSLVIEGTAIVDREIPVGSLIWLGPITEWNEGNVPADNPIMEVKGYKEDSDLKGRHVLRTVTLAKFHRTLPPKAS